MNIQSIAKKLLLSIGIAVECFVGFICFYVVFALFGMVFPCGSHVQQGDISIFVRTNGVHTDICLPTKSEHKDWLSIIDLEAYEDRSKTEYVAIGWGDKGFFLDTPTWAELKASTAFNAMFLPTPTALHVEFMNQPVESETIKEVKISKESYRELIAFVESTFEKKNSKIQLIPGHGYGLTDNFYEAKGSYHLFNTCNVWTNDALKCANIRTAVYSVFPQGNIMHLSN